MVCLQCLHYHNSPQHKPLLSTVETSGDGLGTCEQSSSPSSVIKSHSSCYCFSCPFCFEVESDKSFG